MEAGSQEVEPESGPRPTYRRRVSEQEELLAGARRAASSVSRARGMTFVAILGTLALWELTAGALAWAMLALAAVLTVTFAALVARHRRLRRREARCEILLRLNREGLLRLDRRWDDLRASRAEGNAGTPSAPSGLDPGLQPPGGRHPYADDVHLFGPVSLSALAGPLTSETGRSLFRSWLLEPAAPATVRERQEAVRELAGKLDFRQELAVRGLSGAEGVEGQEGLLEWAEEDPWLARRRWVRLSAWTLPPLTLGLAALNLVGTLPAVWVLPFALQILVLHRVRRRIEADFVRASPAAPLVARYGPQIQLVADEDLEAPLLARLRERLWTEVEGDGAHVVLDRLRRLLDVAESRRNMVYQALDLVFLVSIHVHQALARWKGRWGGRIRGWLEALGRVEALSALAVLGHDHPDWAFPHVSPPGPEPVLRGRGVGHPLLPPRECVRNDVEVGPQGTFLLVTGSNMSGKSTLLRALGANVVLAGAGGPVCAESLTLPAVRLHTSMLVGDSLAGGISRFMAELLRMRRIVEAARGGGGLGGDAERDIPVLYLLDEVLQGTNTAERRIAARAVLRHLLEARAIGAVTTHDLTLHQAPDLERRARAYHFRETVEEGEDGPRLHFDYRLRPGLATTRNALKLLEAVGLGDRVDEEVEDVLPELTGDPDGTA